MPRLDVLAMALTWIEVALVIFVVVFLAITTWAVVARRGAFDRQAQIPLEEDVVNPRTDDDAHEDAR